MLPAPKGGSRTAGSLPAAPIVVVASMLPAPKGGSRFRCSGGTHCCMTGFNAARPEGRESAEAGWWRAGRVAGFNAARPEGRESATWSRQAQSKLLCFNAARPEGRESAPTRKSR